MHAQKMKKKNARRSYREQELSGCGNEANKILETTTPVQNRHVPHEM